MSLGGVYTHLIGLSAVTALVSQRVHPQTLPQKTDYPAITFMQVSGVREITMGTVGGSGLAAPRIQITSWAETYAEAKEVSDAVRVGTDGFSGTFGSTTVKAVVMEGETDTEDRDPKSGRLYFGVIQDYAVWHDESTS